MENGQHRFRFTITLAMGISLLAASLPILNLVQQTSGHSFGQIIASLLAKYDEWTEILAVWVFPSLITLWNEWFDWKIELHAQAKDVLVVIALYFARNVINNIRSQNVWRRVSGAALSPFAIAFALFGSIGFGTLLHTSPAWSLYPPIMALVLFEAVEAIFTSAWVRPTQQAFWKTFGYYAKNTVLPRLVWGLGVAIVGTVSVCYGVERPSELLLSLLALYVLGLVGILLWRGAGLASEKRSEDDTWRAWYARFRESNSTRLGLLIAGVMGTAFAMFLLDMWVLQPLGL